MKTQVGKLVIVSLIGLAFIMPSTGFAQDDQQDQQNNDQQNSEAPAAPDPGTQQLDQQEAQQAAPPATAPQSTDYFYNQLSPYGQWVYYNAYGYVWIPSAGANFTPYSTNGHWVYTDYGWTWVSDYSWGWATFHYGRWAYDYNYGWFWIPGVTWGPAWVAWRHCDGYYGWAPLYPGIDISVSYDWWVNIPTNYWCFVGENYICDRDICDHYIPRSYNEDYCRRTSIIRNTYYDRDRHTTYACGPQRQDVERVTHTNIRPVTARQNTGAGQSSRLGNIRNYNQSAATSNRNNYVAPQRSVTTAPQAQQRNSQFSQQQRNNWNSNAQRQSAQQQHRQQQYQQPRQQTYQQPRQQYQQPRQQTYQQPRQQYQQPRQQTYQQPRQQAYQPQHQAPQNYGGNRGGNSGGGSRRI